MNDSNDGVVVVDENRSNDGRSLFSPLKKHHKNNRGMIMMTGIDAPNENGTYFISTSFLVSNAI
jgi:hypothetical protein